MHRHVETILGRLITNPGLLRRFAERPLDVIAEQGLELTQIEMAALAATDPAVLRACTDALDARLRIASLSADPRPASDPDDQP